MATYISGFTVYSNHPLNTPVFRIRAIIAADSDVSITFFQSVEVERLFGFKGGSNTKIDIALEDLVNGSVFENLSISHATPIICI